MSKPYLIGLEMDNRCQHPHQYFKCSSCGAVFLDHIPVAEDYDESGYYQRKNVLFSSLIKRLMRLFFLCRYSYVKSYHKKAHAGRILDIGCGKGNFLEVAKQDGWTVCGIEPTKRSAEYARNVLNLNVIETGLHESNIADSSYDVISMWHVLEHIPDTSSVLKEAYRVLVEGGILIVAVPNIESIQANLGGGKWFHLDPPRHVIHFSPELLSRLLEQHGFLVEKIHHFSLEYNILGWFQTLQNKVIRSPNFTFSFLKRNSKALPGLLGCGIGWISSLLLFLLLPIIVGLSLLEVLLKRGGTITLIARKKVTVNRYAQ